MTQRSNGSRNSHVVGRRKARHGKPVKRRAPERTSCTSKGGTTKLRFDSEVAALSEAQYYSTLMRKPLRVYRCPACDGWHTAKGKP